MYIGELYQQLVQEARRRVTAGIVTERQLARQCGISQSHMHNVLKSFRSLSCDSADRLMFALRLDIPELLFRFQKLGDLGVRAIPIVRSRVGPGYEPALSSYRSYIPLPSALVDSLKDPVLVELAPDMGLPKPLIASDTVLLDQNPMLRSSPCGAGLWLVAEGPQVRIRYVKVGGTRIYIADESTRHDPAGWNSVSLKDTDILSIVRARVVWFSRAMLADHEPKREGLF